MTYETFCGGLFETNCYLIEAPEGRILFDAPEGACDWLQSRDVDLKLLLLTHAFEAHRRTAEVAERVAPGRLPPEPACEPASEVQRFGVRAAANVQAADREHVVGHVGLVEEVRDHVLPRTQAHPRHDARRGEA